MPRTVSHSSLERHGPLLVIALSVLAGLVGMFDRSLAFHDELINANKALEWVVLDYAMRPVFYALNALTLRVLGNHPYSLVLLSFLSVVITALCLYFLCARLFRPWVGLVCVIGYVGVDMLREAGIRAMPHAPAGMFMVVSICAAVACFNEERVWRQRLMGAVAGLLGIVAFSTHPTMAGYMVALATWTALTWILYLIPRTRSSALARPFRPALWLGIGVVLGIAILSAIYAISYHEGYFSAWWRFANIPQGPESERALTLYYVRTMLLSAAVPAVFLGISILIVVVHAAVRSGARASDRLPASRWFVTVMSLFCLVVSMAMVSLNQWKEGRILASYVPLIALSFACWFATASEVIVDWRGKSGHVLIAISVLLVGLGSIGVITRRVSHDSELANERRHNYLSLYEAVRNVRDPAVGLIAGRGHLGTKAVFVGAAGLTWHRLEPTDTLAKMNPADLRRHLVQNRVRSLFWDLESTTHEEYVAIAANLRAVSGHRVYHWRGLRELWYVDPLTDAFARILSELPYGTKIGVFGELQELSSETGFLIDTVLQANKLYPYVLNVGTRLPGGQLGYLTRNEVDYVLVPAAASNQVSDAHIAAMEELLREVDAMMVEEAGEPPLRLWRIVDREKAISRAE